MRKREQRGKTRLAILIYKSECWLFLGSCFVVFDTLEVFVVALASLVASPFVLYA
jgi:hypothetical protein